MKIKILLIGALIVGVSARNAWAQCCDDGVNPCGGIIYVDDSASGANTGANWMDAYTDLAAALLVAPPDSEVWVAEGIYNPGGGSLDVFRLPSSVRVIGGFTGVSGTEGGGWPMLVIQRGGSINSRRSSQY